MATLQMGIASPDAMRARTFAIARGEMVPGPEDPKIWFPSTESFAKVLSDRNRALLDLIASTRPGSLQDLARTSGRAPGNLSRTLRRMESFGLVRLSKGERGRLRPEVPYDRIALTLAVG